MALVISSVGDRGVLAHERTGFKIKADCNLKNFTLFKTIFTSEGFRNSSSASYWFPPQKVKLGDRVVVYTRAGSDSYMANEDGSTTYFRYWGLDEVIYSSKNDGIVLSNVVSWSLSKDI